jgi:hypothetical protein
LPSSPESRSQAATFVEEDLFRFLVDLEIRKAGRLHYCVSVVCMTPHGIEGRDESDFVRRAAAAASRAFRATDIVSTLSPSLVCTLLVNAETRDLPDIFRRTTTELDNLARSPSGERERIAWNAGGSCYPVTATTGADLLRQAADLTTRARADGAGTLRLPD